MSDELLSKKMAIQAIEEYFGIGSVPKDGADLSRIEKIAAAIDSANYMNAHMPEKERYPHSHTLLRAGMSARKVDGLILEFGVYSGQTLNHIAEMTDQTVFGFDSFEGLPEDWRSDVGKGTFRRSAPPSVRDNVELVIGWFEDSLPPFLASHSGRISLLHVDCDLYSSTRTIFYHLASRIVAGTIIVFDEYFNYVGWRKHEFKAFQEFIGASGLSYRYIGLVSKHQQVAVEIL